MISRLTAFAATFAIVTTASLAFAASAQQARFQTPAAAEAVRVVQLDTVVVVAKRVAKSAV
jgi:hypothetical protein